MDCSFYARVCLLILASALSISARSQRQNRLTQPAIPKSESALQSNQQPTIVSLRWGPRPGVSRYRLQLAGDVDFTDIVFDRIVTGHEYRINDLPPGRYYWRVAALGARTGSFSSAGVVEVRGQTKANDPARSNSKGSTSGNVTAGPPITNQINTGIGWYAAVGNVAQTVVASLRSQRTFDIVGVSDGRVFALDAVNGVALWTARPRVRSPQQKRTDTTIALLPLRTRNGLDNVIVLSANDAAMLEGRTGRELWRTTLPAVALSAVAVADAKVFILDNSLYKLLVINANDGSLGEQIQLPRRAAGPPVVLNYQNAHGVMVALDDGRIEIFDQTGKKIRSGDAGSPATTSPLFVKSARGELVLVGTRNGLTALTAGELRPLGRVTLKDDLPRGRLSAQDLDTDGIVEVVMFTARGRVAVVKSDEGKIIWEADAGYGDAVAFADINADRVLDLLMTGREGLAFALSGRDGTIVWKEEKAAGTVANHSPSPLQRAPLVVQVGAGVLLIAGDSSRGGLRAVQFSRATAPLNH